MRTRITERRAENVLLGTTVLALTGALLHLGAPAPPDWSALEETLGALPWGGPLWLLVQTALALTDAAF